MMWVLLPDGSREECADRGGLLALAERWRQKHGLPVVALRRDRQFLDLAADRGGAAAVGMVDAVRGVGLGVGFRPFV